MVIFKLGLLTCAFYVGLTILLEAGFWAVAYFKGFGFFWTGKYWFWTVGAKLGLVFGALWMISFSAAWYIVYMNIKSNLPSNG